VSGTTPKHSTFRGDKRDAASVALWLEDATRAAYTTCRLGRGLIQATRALKAIRARAKDYGVTEEYEEALREKAQTEGGLGHFLSERIPRLKATRKSSSLLYQARIQKEQAQIDEQIMNPSTLDSFSLESSQKLSRDDMLSGKNSTDPQFNSRRSSEQLKQIYESRQQGKSLNDIAGHFIFQIKEEGIQAMQIMANPPHPVETVMKGICILLGRSNSNWTDVRTVLGYYNDDFDDRPFLQKIITNIPTKISMQNAFELRSMMNTEISKCDLEKVISVANDSAAIDTDRRDHWECIVKASTAAFYLLRILEKAYKEIEKSVLPKADLEIAAVLQPIPEAYEALGKAAALMGSLPHRIQTIHLILEEREMSEHKNTSKTHKKGETATDRNTKNLQVSKAAPSRLEMARILLQRETKAERRERIAAAREHDAKDSECSVVSLQRPPTANRSRVKKTASRLKNQASDSGGGAKKKTSRPTSRGKALLSRSVTPNPSRRRNITSNSVRSATPIVRRSTSRKSTSALKTGRNSTSAISKSKISSVSSTASTLTRKSRKSGSAASTSVSSTASTLKRDKTSRTRATNPVQKSRSRATNPVQTTRRSRQHTKHSDEKHMNFRTSQPSITIPKGSGSSTSQKKGYRSKSLKSPRKRSIRAARKTRSRSPSESRKASRNILNLSINTGAERADTLPRKPWNPPASKKMEVLFDPIVKYSPSASPSGSPRSQGSAKSTRSVPVRGRDCTRSRDQKMDIDALRRSLREEEKFLKSQIESFGLRLAKVQSRMRKIKPKDKDLQNMSMRALLGDSIDEPNFLHRRATPSPPAGQKS